MNQSESYIAFHQSFIESYIAAIRSYKHTTPYCINHDEPVLTHYWPPIHSWLNIMINGNLYADCPLLAIEFHVFITLN